MAPLPCTLSFAPAATGRKKKNAILRNGTGPGQGERESFTWIAVFESPNMLKW
jgi:hypothetical protein